MLKTCLPALKALCAPVDGDSVAVIGDNRKLLLFPLKELPEMPRGKGVRLQRYKDGGLADAKIFRRKARTYIRPAGRSFVPDRIERIGVGVLRRSRAPPQKGFPKVGQLHGRALLTPRIQAAELRIILLRLLLLISADDF